MELRHYFALLLKWSWLIILCGLLATAAGFFVYREFVLWPYYQAKATIRVGNDDSASNLDFQSLQALRETYVELGSRPPVTNEVIHTLGLPIDSDELKKLIDLIPIGETQLIEIEVTYQEPVTTAAIANELAKQLITMSQSNRQSPVQVQLVTIAKPPTQVSLSSYLGIVIAGVLGAIGSIGVILLFEQFKDKFESVYEVESLTGLPVLADFHFPKSRWLSFLNRQPVVDPLQIVIDNGRLVRLKLSRNDTIYDRTILLTGPEPIDDISLISRGLATAWADASSRPIIVNTDLNEVEPYKVESYDEAEDEDGEELIVSKTLVTSSEFLTNGELVAEKALITADATRFDHSNGNGHLQPIGKFPSDRFNSVEAVGARLNHLKHRGSVVIVEGTSVLDKPDNAIVGSQVNDIVLLLHNKKTSVNDTRKAIHILEQVGGTISGVIFIN